MSQNLSKALQWVGPTNLYHMVFKLNQFGMELLNMTQACDVNSSKDQIIQKSLGYLKMAEKISTQIQCPAMMKQSDKNTLMALIFNNLGCYYKKNKKPKVALQYMLNAL